MVIYDLFPSLELSALQNIIAGGIYGVLNTKIVTSDGLKIEFRRSNIVTLKLSLG